MNWFTHQAFRRFFAIYSRDSKSESVFGFWYHLAIQIPLFPLGNSRLHIDLHQRDAQAEQLALNFLSKL